MRFVLIILILFSQLFGASPTFDERSEIAPNIECYGDTFCIESVHEGNQIELVISKLIPWDFTLLINLRLENMVADRKLPLIRSFTARGKESVLNLRIAKPNRKWGYHFDLKWVVGLLNATHDDQYVYSLPFGRHESFMVSQTYNGLASHEGKNAIDWDMPRGTGVRAARDGIVVEIEESRFQGGLDPTLKSKANFVRIKHSDGTIGNYVHLMPNGVRVYEGDRVRRGDLIAYSGDTGYSSGPHLHFEVFTITGALQHRTIPVRFRANGRNGERLEEGQVYGH